VLIVFSCLGLLSCVFSVVCSFVCLYVSQLCIVTVLFCIFPINVMVGRMRCVSKEIGNGS